MSNTFTKGVHRFVVDLVTEDSASVVRTYQSISNGAWEVNPSATISTDAFYPENIADCIANALSVVLGNSACSKINNVDNGINRVGVSLPTADGQASTLTLELSGANTSHWIRGTAETIPVASSSNGAVFKLGSTVSGAFSALGGTSGCTAGRIVYPSGASGTSTTSDVNGIDFRGKLIIKLVVKDDWYAIGVSHTYSLNTIEMAEGAYIDSNIIIGNNYALYPNSYNLSEDGDISTVVILLDNNKDVTLHDGFNFEFPSGTIQNAAKLSSVSFNGVDTGWYYASAKHYPVIAGDWGLASGSLDKAKFLGDYITKGIVENAVTINGQSFDVLLGVHQQAYCRNVFFRKHA